MTSFHDINFPLPLAFGASGGPQRQTEIVTLANGAEQRNTTKANSRRQYDAGVGIKNMSDVQILVRFFEARFGQLYGFRFRDPFDHSSASGEDLISHTDQTLGFGDGQTRDFQLIKAYEDEQNIWEREITKPVASTVMIAINGALEAAYSLNSQTGMISFDAPPPSASIISAGFEFDVPVRFGADNINVSLESFGAGSAVHVPLIEIMPYA